MSDWKKTNFAEVEPKPIGDSRIVARFTRSAIGSPKLGVSRFSFPAGERFPFAHRHREQEEAYVVIAGSGRIKLDDEIVDLAEGDVLRVAPEVGRMAEAGPGGLELICIGGLRPEGGDGEPVPDFWD